MSLHKIFGIITFSLSFVIILLNIISNRIQPIYNHHKYKKVLIKNKQRQNLKKHFVLFVQIDNEKNSNINNNIEITILKKTQINLNNMIIYESINEKNFSKSFTNFMLTFMNNITIKKSIKISNKIGKNNIFICDKLDDNCILNYNDGHSHVRGKYIIVHDINHIKLKQYIEEAHQKNIFLLVIICKKDFVTNL